MEKSFPKKLLLYMVLMASAAVIFTGCETNMAKVKDMLKPTSIEREKYNPSCKKSWKGKTMYIDFDTTASWYYSYASGLSAQIRDQLVEDVVDNGCFKVQDYGSGYRGKNFDYRVHVVVARPKITMQRNVIRKISATYRIKIYNKNNNLIKAKTSAVKYDAPSLVVSSGNSQQVLLENYAYNVSVAIRKAMYTSLK